MKWDYWDKRLMEVDVVGILRVSVVMLFWMDNWIVCLCIMDWLLLIIFYSNNNISCVS